MRLVATDFTVEGKGDFPIDMLRYDECWPADTVSAATIAANFASIGEGRGRNCPMPPVKLRTYKYGGPTIGRWESFGWRVVEVDS